MSIMHEASLELLRWPGIDDHGKRWRACRCAPASARLVTRYLTLSWKGLLQ